MSDTGAIVTVVAAPDARLQRDLTGAEMSDTWTMAGTTAQVSVPAAARIIVVTASAALRVRLDGAPSAAAGTGTLVAGRVVPANTRTAMVVGTSGAARLLHLLGGAGTVVTVEALP